MTATTELSWKRPPIYRAQYEAIWNPARYAVIEASTKSGKTHGCMVWLLEQALEHGRPGDNFWWCAPVYQTAKIAYRRYRRGLHGTNLVTDTVEPVAQFREGDLAIRLPNDMTLWFKSMEKPDTLYGEDVKAAVVDEASRCREESWHALRSTLTATRGQVRIIGNVKGRKNWAYRLARHAERQMALSQGHGAFHYAKLTAWDAVKAGVLALAEIMDARAALPRHIFRQLYLAEPADDGGNPFGLAAIAACVAAMSPNSPAVWGWDLGRWQDYVVGVGLDRFGTVCRFERWRHVSWPETLRRIQQVVGKTPAWVDATHGSVGDPMIDFLAVAHPNYHGFEFTGPSKQQLVESLVLSVQRQRVHFPRGPIQSEMESFEYAFTRTGVRYTAPEGMHDDCVMALALANYGRANLPTPGAFATRAVQGWNPT